MIRLLLQNCGFDGGDDSVKSYNIFLYSWDFTQVYLFGIIENQMLDHLPVLKISTDLNSIRRDLLLFQGRHNCCRWLVNIYIDNVEILISIPMLILRVNEI